MQIDINVYQGHIKKVLLSVSGAPAVDLSAELGDLWSPLPADHHNLYIVSKGATGLRYEYRLQGVKRTLESAEFAHRATVNMWDSRKFTHTTIRCNLDSHTVRCHRAIIAGSPVFEAELERWSADGAELTVEGSGKAVEAMVRFLCTGELSEDASSAEVLVLAHRYQVDDLVNSAKVRILKDLTPSTVVEASRALRVLRNEDEHRECWEQFCRLAKENESLFAALALVV